MASRNWPTFGGLDDDDEDMPMGRNTLKLRSKAIVESKGAAHSGGPSRSTGAYGSENGMQSQSHPHSYENGMQSHAPPPSYGGYPQQQQQRGGYSHAQQPTSYPGYGGGGGLPPRSGGPGMGLPPRSGGPGAGAGLPPRSGGPGAGPPLGNWNGNNINKADWRISSDMMNQKWGTVLRTLSER